MGALVLDGKLLHLALMVGGEATGMMHLMGDRHHSLSLVMAHRTGGHNAVARWLWHEGSSGALALVDPDLQDFTTRGGEATTGSVHRESGSPLGRDRNGRGSIDGDVRPIAKRYEGKQVWKYSV